MKWHHRQSFQHIRESKKKKAYCYSQLVVSQNIWQLRLKTVPKLKNSVIQKKGFEVNELPSQDLIQQDTGIHA